MATLRINSIQANTIISSSSSPLAGALATTNASLASAQDSLIFGTGEIGTSQFFVFQGSVPTDFSTFTSVSTRISDLLVAIPVGSTTLTSVAGSSSSRWLVGSSTGTSRTLAINNAAGSVARSSNTVTVTVAAAANGHRIVPGQSITLAGMSDTSFNGTFTVATTPSATTFTFSQTAANASINGSTGTLTVPYTAILSGTATWFCLSRTNSTFVSTSTFTGFGAMLGTVGATGSGADLEIVSTSITAGTTYTSAGLYVNMPYNWSV